MFRWLQEWFAGTARDSAGPVPTAAAGPAPDSAPAAAAASAPAPAVPASEGGPSFEQIERVDLAWKAWLYERADDAGLETSEAETRVLDALAAILGAQGAGATLVRRMPGLVPQLLQSLRSEEFSGAALSRTISSDPVLVAAVLRLANSAHDGTGTAIHSVEQAVILIGQEGLRQLITSVAFRPIIDLHSGWYTRQLAPRLWEHSERCAIAVRRSAQALGIASFDAFLAALLQNVGQIVALRMMDAQTGGAPGLGGALFLARLARDTSQLAASIAREWTFPPAVAQALLEAGSMGGARRGRPTGPLGQLLKLSAYLGKLRMLAEAGLLDDADPALFAGLPAHAHDLYAALAASRSGPL